MNKLAKKDIVKIINDYQLYSYDILKKFVILNDIDKEMKKRDTWQGKNFN